MDDLFAEDGLAPGPTTNNSANHEDGDTRRDEGPGKTPEGGAGAETPEERPTGYPVLKRKVPNKPQEISAAAQPAVANGSDAERGEANNQRQLSCKISAPLFGKLKVHSFSSGRTISSLVEDMIEKYCPQYEVRTKEPDPKGTNTGL